MWIHSIIVAGGSSSEGGEGGSEPEPEVTLSSISAVYNGSVKVGETVNKADFTVTATYSDSTTATVTDFTISTVDTTTAGSKTVTITYEGKTCTVTITVAESTVTPDPEDPSTGTEYSAVFTDKLLSVESGGITFTADKAGYGYDASGRGVQFLQSGGVVNLTSASSFNGITSISVAVATNASGGMDISASVGGTAFKVDGASPYHLAKTSGTTPVVITFTGTAINGKVVITLTPSGSSSMFIKSITIKAGGSSSEGGEGGGESGGDDVTLPENLMERQTYNASTMDNQRLQDKLLATDGAIGLPDSGTYSALVVPVQFTDTTISSSSLTKLNKALNGSTTDTGWQSVKTYYQTSSFGALNLSFDIQSVYVASGSSSYYNTYNSNNVDGPELLLRQVLAYYEDKLDLTKYDVNNDGCIDAVYLIYSAPVEYEDDDSIYWAYVTWSNDQTAYDGVYPYYYLFAGFDFMDEGVSGDMINASTYIHETGHLLGLDDYYDYYEGEGSDMGLGGADMMDYTIGDQNVYSKTMLDWVTPTVVTQTGTYTLTPSQTAGDCLMLLLDYDGSYFSEYLLIDLYTSTGLNYGHSNNLYDGASYGVRIYHVDSTIENPWSDKYGSFTDNNNSVSALPLITLVEADGETKFASGDGLAERDDLWQSGDVFSTIAGEYTRHDGKVVNFDIIFTNVSSSGATLTITFLN